MGGRVAEVPLDAAPEFEKHCCYPLEAGSKTPNENF
jgi:hypothetical protein